MHLLVICTPFQHFELVIVQFCIDLLGVDLIQHLLNSISYHFYLFIASFEHFNGSLRIDSFHFDNSIKGISVEEERVQVRLDINFDQIHSLKDRELA